MVEEQVVARGIKDPGVIEALLRVPRHEFVPPADRSSAYADAPVSIGHGQTISQPYMVALMTELLALTGSEKVLEIGTGSGYQTAILSGLCRVVYTIERIEPLLSAARKVWPALGMANIRARLGDGSAGWIEESPFDAIIVTAAAPEALSALAGQLAPGGRMVVPMGDLGGQVLKRILRKQDRFEPEEFCRCVFVPLVGKFGLHANGN